MTLPAKAGSFSGNGMTCSDGVAVYRWRLKAPSEPWSESEPQDVQRGIQVSTDAQAAGTAMPALAEGLGDLLAADRTGLRCAGRIHLDQRPTSFRRFVGHDRDELAPASIVNGLGQHRAGQPLDVQIFDGDQPVRLNQRVRRLVMEVTPLIGDVAMHPRYCLACFQSPPRALLASRELPLGQAQPSFSHAQVTWIGDLGPVAQDSECRQPDVDTDGQVGRW